MMKKRYMVYIAIILAIAAVSIYYAVEHSSSQKAAVYNSDAPNFKFLAANGSVMDLSEFSGKPVVIWFVATWCSSCAQGNEALNNSYQFFKQHGIRVIELEIYNDLGYKGMPIGQFVSDYAGNAYLNKTIIPAYAGYNMSVAYDPKGYLDIYYLVSGSGKIVYVNDNGMFDTVNQLIAAINNTI